MKEKNVKTTQEKGITLIALVVTIVVLLILAGVSITVLFGDSGIITMAQKAADETNKAAEKDQEDLNKLNEYLTNGLVISDVANDDLDNTAKGNQFVWIPVEVDSNGNTPNFVRIEGFSSNKRQSYLASCQEAGKEGITTTESIEMYQSVADNGGFYIARFEAGLVGTNEADLSSTERPTPDGITQKPVSKKGVVPWNYIPWSTSAANGGDGTDKLPGDEAQNGAVKVARSMHTKSSSCGVTSTLCYGVQWDAVMQYIDPNYLWKTGETDNVASDSVVRNGEGKGNYADPATYEGSLALTGSNPAYQQKHIYDLAGNVHEWTMEAYNTDGRVNRGRLLRLYRF